MSTSSPVASALGWIAFWLVMGLVVFGAVMLVLNSNDESWSQVPGNHKCYNHIVTHKSMHYKDYTTVTRYCHA